MKGIFVFTTSESDNTTVIKNGDTFYSRRYGLPYEPITIDEVRRLAWLECNRRGKFSHLIERKDGHIPVLTNKEAQDYIVTNFIKYG